MDRKKLKSKELIEKSEDDEQITDEKSENQREIEERKSPKTKIVREIKSEKEEELEDNEVEDEEVQEHKQIPNDESEEKSSEIEENGKNSNDGFMTVLVSSKRKRVREKEKEDKQVTDKESEEESETEEKEKKSNNLKSPKKIKMMEQTEKKISNEKSNRQISLAIDEDDDDDDGDDDDDDGDDDDDCEDNLELKYDSDGSLIDDDEKCGVIAHSSKFQLSPEEKEKLINLFIELEHKVLPQHKIEKIAGTRALSKEEKAEFEKYAELRTGKYLPHENKILRRNWKNFCTANEWNVNKPMPFLQMRYKNKVAFINFNERMKFIQFLANGLNNRSLYSVFNRFKVLYEPHKVSRYSTYEDDIIIDYVQRYKISDRERDRKFAELASILKRTRASVWRRFRVLKKKRNISSDL